ncbi:hemopexin repeat-containing protein [Streptomyces sp. NPDC058646]|uniref:hemopexin repeat-containing protein n=1 Tax=Streptomyces sp. NPDC058646 TaxID=3346574 RepID=UPI003647C9CD
MTNEAMITAEAREQRLGRWHALLSGMGVEGAGASRVAKSGSVNLLSGVWLHAAARAEQGLELTELERSILAPLQQVLGEDEVGAIGRIYREQRSEGRSVAIVPQAVATRSLSEGFDRESYLAAVAEVLPRIAQMPNVAVVDRARLADGGSVDTPEFTAALAEYGYGVTTFTGEGDDEADGLQAREPFRARMEWDTFYCHEAVGDQGGGRDEIYWTAASNAGGYTFKTRTTHTGSVEERDKYPIYGDYVTGSHVFFDTRLDGCGTTVITLWEKDQSNDEWYDALGTALTKVVELLQISANFSSIIPKLDLYGYVHMGLSLLATLWEPLRNKDDLVQSRGFAFGRADMATLYNRPNRTMPWTFDRKDYGMGRFSLNVRYTGDEPGAAPSGDGSLISTGWRGLFGTMVSHDMDAACNVPNDAHKDVYLFKGEQYLRYDVRTEGVTSGPKDIAEGFPGLESTAFTRGVDATCAVPGKSTDFYLFAGAMYVNYNNHEDEIKWGPRKIAEAFPPLAGTIFERDIQAACPVPGHGTDLYLFKGDQYVRYNAHYDRIIRGPLSIAAGWPQLAGTTFASNLDAACAVPNSSTHVYLFKGDRYTNTKV